MGCFSWTCAKSGLSIATVWSGLPVEYSGCYLVTPDKVIYEPEYDGYGMFGGVDVYELLGEGDRDLGIERNFEPELRSEKPFDVKVVLAKFYKGESYGELEPSKLCPYQGFMHDEDYLASLKKYETESS